MFFLVRLVFFGNAKTMLRRFNSKLCKLPIVLILESNRHPHSQEAFKGNSSLHHSIPKLFVQLFSATKTMLPLKTRQLKHKLIMPILHCRQIYYCPFCKNLTAKHNISQGSSFSREIHVRSGAIVVPELIFYEGSWVTPAGYTASCVTKSSLLPY